MDVYMFTYTLNTIHVYIADNTFSNTHTHTHAGGYREHRRRWRLRTRPKMHRPRVSALQSVVHVSAFSMYKCIPVCACASRVCVMD